MTYLLDTVVLSELRKRQGHPAVLDWLRSKPARSLFISVVTIGEIERGVELKRPRDPVFADALAFWLEQLIRSYENRILPVDILIGRRWGKLTARLGHAGPIF